MATTGPVPSFSRASIAVNPETGVEEPAASHWGKGGGGRFVPGAPESLWTMDVEADYEWKDGATVNPSPEGWGILRYPENQETGSSLDVDLYEATNMIRVSGSAFIDRPEFRGVESFEVSGRFESGGDNVPARLGFCWGVAGVTDNSSYWGASATSYALFTDGYFIRVSRSNASYGNDFVEVVKVEGGSLTVVETFYEDVDFENEPTNFRLVVLDEVLYFKMWLAVDNEPSHWNVVDVPAVAGGGDIVGLHQWSSHARNSDYADLAFSRVRPALLIEEGTTNLAGANGMPNLAASTMQPSGTNSWVVSNAGATYTPNGTDEALVEVDSTQYTGIQMNFIPMTSGEVQTFSVDIKYVDGAQEFRGILQNQPFGDAKTLDGEPIDASAQTVTIPDDGQWHRYTFTRTADSSGTASIHLQPNGSFTSPSSMRFRRFQLEQKPYATSWQPGGTARTGEELVVPGGLVSPTGTIELDVNIPDVTLASGRNINIIGTAQVPGWLFISYGVVTGAVRLGIRVGGSGFTEYGTHSMSGPVRLALRWTADGNAELLVNGVVEVVLDSHDAAAITSNIRIGGRLGDANLTLNERVGGVRFSNVRRSDAELLDYEAPLENDADTVALYHWDTADVPAGDVETLERLGHTGSFFEDFDHPDGTPIDGLLAPNGNTWELIENGTTMENTIDDGAAYLRSHSGKLSMLLETDLVHRDLIFHQKVVGAGGWNFHHWLAWSDDDNYLQMKFNHSSDMILTSSLGGVPYAYQHIERQLEHGDTMRYRWNPDDTLDMFHNGEYITTYMLRPEDVAAFGGPTKIGMGGVTGSDSYKLESLSAQSTSGSPFITKLSTTTPDVPSQELVAYPDLLTHGQFFADTFSGPDRPLEEEGQWTVGKVSASTADPLVTAGSAEVFGQSVNNNHVTLIPSVPANYRNAETLIKVSFDYASEAFSHVYLRSDKSVNYANQIQNGLDLSVNLRSATSYRLRLYERVDGSSLPISDYVPFELDSPGDSFWIRFRAVGSNAMYRSWKDSETEPSTWAASVGTTSGDGAAVVQVDARAVGGSQRIDEFYLSDIVTVTDPGGIPSSELIDPNPLLLEQVLAAIDAGDSSINPQLIQAMLNVGMFGDLNDTPAVPVVENSRLQLVDAGDIDTGEMVEFDEYAFVAFPPPYGIAVSNEKV